MKKLFSWMDRNQIKLVTILVLVFLLNLGIQSYRKHIPPANEGECICLEIGTSKKSEIVCGMVLENNMKEERSIIMTISPIPGIIFDAKFNEVRYYEIYKTKCE